jgi:hypothetical protein
MASDEAASGGARTGSAPAAGTPRTSAGRKGGSWQDRLMELATPFHYASLPVAFVLLLFLTRHLWFIGDIYDFFARMQSGTCWTPVAGRPPVCGGLNALSLLIPHNEHWSTVPLLITAAIYRFFGLHSYLPYIGLEILGQVVVTHLLWRWMRRLGEDPWVATALATVFLLLGAGAEDIEWSFQFAWVLPVALGLAGLYLLDVDGPDRWGRDFAYWVLAVLALMCSGIGICMLLLGAGFALLRRGWRAALRAALVPAAVYLVWLAWVAISAPALLSTTPAAKSLLFQVPEYVWTGLTDALQGATGLAGLGGVLALGLGYWLVRNHRLARGPAAIAFVAPVVALVFFALVGIGRVSLGVAEAGSGRYSYVWIVLLLPASALAVSQLVRRWAPARWLTVALAAVMAVNGIAGLAGYADVNAPIQQQERGEILGAAHLLQSGAPLAVSEDAGVEPVFSPNLTVADLRSMIAAGKMPMSAPITAADTLQASVYLQVGVSPTHPGAAPEVAPTIGNDVLPPPTPAGNDCLAVANGASTSQLQLVFSGPGWIAITPTVSGTISVRLAPEDAPLDLTAAAATFDVTAGQTVYLTVTASGTAPLISLPPGTTTVCGAGG